MSPVSTVKDSMKLSCHSLRRHLPQRSEFAVRVVNIGFVTDEMALLQICQLLLWLPSVGINFINAPN